MGWIRVRGGDDDTPDAGGLNGGGAGGGASVGAAGFERDVKRGAPRQVAVLFGIVERLDFSVRPARLSMPAFADDGARFDQDCADHGIGGGVAAAALRELEREAHELAVTGGSRGFCGTRHDGIRRSGPERAPRWPHGGRASSGSREESPILILRSAAL
jgi:hypothetical protein